MVLSTRKQRPHQFDQNYRGKTYVGIQIHAINENVGSSRTYIGYCLFGSGWHCYIRKYKATGTVIVLVSHIFNALLVIC